MPVIYIPSERCPKCPFNTLCEEERLCPISEEGPVNILDMKEELRQFAKVRKTENPIKIVRELHASRRSQDV